MSAEIILERLTKVKQSGSRQWLACCPSHEDRDPSLSIKELSDGRILINCFSGCGGADVMAAIGLTLSDLYPDGELREWMRSGGRKRAVERKTESILANERVILELAAKDRESGKRMSRADLQREQIAFMKLRTMA